MPEAPRDLTVTITGTTTATLDWLDCETTETGYRVYQAEGASGVFLGGSHLAANTVTAAITNLSPGTLYRWLVQVITPTGTANSNIVSGTTTAGATKPTAPSALAASLLTTSSFHLTWTDNSSDEDGFRLTFTVVATGVQFVRELPANATSFGANGLQPATLYRVDLVAYNTAGPSTTVTIYTSTLIDPPGVPTGPGGGTAVPLSENSIKFDWLDLSMDETSFAVQMRTGSAAFMDIGFVERNVQTFTATNLHHSTEYDFRCYAKNNAGRSTEYAEASATTLSPQPALPTTPTGFEAWSISPTAVRLTWDADSAVLASSIKVYRAQTSGVPVARALIATTSPSGTPYVDTTAVAVTTYEYDIAASTARGDSAATAVIEVTTPAALLEGPALLTFTASAITETTIGLHWSAPADTQGAVTIETSADGGAPWVGLAGVATRPGFYLHTGLAAETTYYYRASLTAGTPTWLAANATTLAAELAAAPTASVITSAVADGPNYISVDWVTLGTNATSATVRHRVGAGDWTASSSLPIVQTHYVIPSLTGGTTYEVLVRVSNAVGNADSASINVDTPSITGGRGERISWAGGKVRTFVRSYDKDDGDVAVLTADQPLYVTASLNNAPNETTGPFAELRVGGVIIASNNPANGTALVVNYKLDTDDALTVTFSGAGTGVGSYTLTVSPA